MKYLDEYRDAVLAKKLSQEIHRTTTKPWTIMEICGGQTHSIVKYGLTELLPKTLQLVHGPGCPVCVTPTHLIDRAVEIAARQDVIFTSFGDMLRVPGSSTNLLSVKATGGDVRIVYSPLDALKIAEQNKEKEVVFFGVGFETTAPATALALVLAKERALRNFSMLISHVLVPPALTALLSGPDCRIQGLLAAGHVCAIMGCEEYLPIAAQFHVPIVVTGFEPLDILQGILLTVQQLESGRAEVENQYRRVVRSEGNPSARALIQTVFQVTDRHWRGLGEIPNSGLCLTAPYASFDASSRFRLRNSPSAEPTECQAGLVLQGLIKPTECPAFGGRCTPEHPLGAPMVSGEGACAAYHRYNKPVGSEYRLCPPASMK